MIEHIPDQAMLDGAFLNYLNLMVEFAENNEQANRGDIRFLTRLRDAAVRVERFKESHNREWAKDVQCFTISPHLKPDAYDYFTKEHLATLESHHDNDAE